MFTRELRRTTASFHIIIQEYTSLESSAAPRISEAEPYIGDAALYRQLFIYLEQLEDPVRHRTSGAEAKPDIEDAALYRQLFTYLL